jgi:hypothetical protein
VRLVLSSRGVALVDAEEFDGFAVELPAGLPLDDLGQPVPGQRDEVDVPAGRVRDLARDLGLPHSWVHDFDAMLEQVAPLGWYDADRDTVRAHVVRSS